MNRVIAIFIAIGWLIGVGIRADMTTLYVPNAPAPPVLAAQIIIGGIQEPPEYPDGVYCTPNGDVFKGLQTPDHPCHCKNMVMKDADGCCNVRITNDSSCKQWCHEKHCSCPMECKG